MCFNGLQKRCKVKSFTTLCQMHHTDMNTPALFLMITYLSFDNVKLCSLFPFTVLNIIVLNLCNERRSWDGPVVRAFTSNQCVPGLISRSSIICGLNLLVLFSALRGFSPGTLVFPSPQNQYDLISLVHHPTSYSQL